MTVAVDLRVLELLSSRLCHELISPVGAINNGLELMEEDDPAFVKEATKLIASSARTAGKRLDFYRFAYGSGRTGAARDVTTGLLEGSKSRCEWSNGVSELPTEWQRVACNMVVLAVEVLPRGGTVQVAPVAGKPGLVATATGETINATPELQAVLAGNTAVADLTARSVHAYYTAKLAEALGARLSLSTAQTGSAVFTVA